MALLDSILDTIGVHPGFAGSGIGLATCRRVVDAHGGEMGLEESPGGGTTVWVRLPRR